ncbi:hypothetical protein N9164_16890 [Draconibacterium sp.]|nr:hypothetical protein [Draconibacterium sp.]
MALASICGALLSVAFGEIGTATDFVILCNVFLLAARVDDLQGRS